MYRYKLVSTGDSSARYGNCDVCGKHVTEVFIQREERRYRFEHNGKIYEGWTGEGCHYLFGHKECLIAKRKTEGL